MGIDVSSNWVTYYRGNGVIRGASLRSRSEPETVSNIFVIRKQTWKEWVCDQIF